MLQLFPEFFQQVPIHFIFQITEHHIQLGSLPYLLPFQSQTRIPDPAAKQGHIRHNRFHKSVMGSSQHLSVRRLIDAPPRILLAVNQRRSSKSLDQHQRLAQKNRGYDVIPIKTDSGFGKANKPIRKGLHICQSFQLLRL